VIAAACQVDGLLYAAFIMLAFGTWLGGLLTVQTGLYFTGHTCSRVIVVLNALFDSGAVVYLGLWGIGQISPKASLAKIVGGYLGLGVVLFSVGAYFWTVADPKKDEDGIIEEEEEKEEEKEPDGSCKLSEELLTTVSFVPYRMETTQLTNEFEGEVPMDEPEVDLDGNRGSSEDHQLQLVHSSSSQASDGVERNHDADEADYTIIAERSPRQELLTTVSFVPSWMETTQSTNELEVEVPTDEQEGDADDNRDSTEDHQLQLGHHKSLEPLDGVERSHDADEVDYVIIAKRSARQQLTSTPALMLALFFGIHTTANQWALTTTRDFLAYLGDDELNNRYLTIFTLLLPASLLALPFVDVIIIRLGFHGGFQCINVLALAYNLIRTTSDNLHVQIIGFIFFSFFRCFLFGVTFSFLPTMFASNVNGKATGLLYMITGLTAFLNIPFVNLAVQTYDGDFFIPNLIYTILVVPCMVAAWYGI
jgi:hypothetical protein